MSSNPIKLFAFAGVAAAIAAGFLAQDLDGAEHGTAPASSLVQGMFGSSSSGANMANAAPRLEPAAARQQALGFGTVVLNPDKGGQYRTMIEIDGYSVPMLVDTGATVVALRHEDAAKLGINPAPSDFTIPISTANGELKAAPARLREARLANIVVSDVRAVVMPRGAMAQSLLGMSFMSKLSGFEVSGGQLILKP